MSKQEKYALGQLANTAEANDRNISDTTVLTTVINCV